MDITSPQIIERYKNLRFREPVGATGESGAANRVLEAHGDNPLCGDDLRVRIELEDAPGGPVIRRARYAGFGCSLCLASADVLMEHVEGMAANAAKKLTVEDVKRLWGGLEVGRSRQDCVALCANVLRRALEGVS